jgi:hypothetical protein
MALHKIQASPENVRIGVFDATIPPILTIASGDTVVLECVSGDASTYPPAASGFVVPTALRAINDASPVRHPGHIITGPECNRTWLRARGYVLPRRPSALTAFANSIDYDAVGLSALFIIQRHISSSAKRSGGC